MKDKKDHLRSHSIFIFGLEDLVVTGEQEAFQSLNRESRGGNYGSE